jgi:patatin-like phospholipase/acyl hydrolase
MYNVMSLDGGGIKGLLTARLLARLEAEHPTLIADIDLFAGTSTGGILALGLAAGKAPSDIVDMYLNHAKTIFEDSIWDNLLDLGGAVGADYGSGGLKRTLEDIFGDMLLGDLPKKVLIPTFQAVSDTGPAWRPKFFNNYLGSDTSERVVDVAMRTSAAPTYFPSYQGYVDGGTVANNPAMAAIATCLDPKGAAVSLDDIKLLSVSTGSSEYSIDGDTNDWGWVKWARPILDILVGGVSGVSDFQCGKLLGDDYLRLNTVLDRDVALDSIEGDSMEYLLAAADGVDLTDVLAWLRMPG